MAHWARGWAATRRRVLERDGYVCWLCRKPGANSVDHVIPRALGGSHGESNLRAAHGWCNSQRGKRMVLPRARANRWS